MAGVETEVSSGSDAGESSDLNSLLSGEGRDFLIRNNGDQVNISSLENKVVALYFSASWCGPCKRFTPKLIEAYGELSSKGMDFEVVFISADHDENSFAGYFSKMPWLAIPFSDSGARERLDGRFEVQGIPHLVVVDWNGKLITEDGVKIIGNYGSDGYPFTPEKIKKMEEDEEEAKKNQTLQSVLGSPTRDFLISNNGNKVPIAELEGKIVALHFSIGSRPPCRELTSILTEMYGKLKEKGESFEIVLVSLDHEETSFEQDFAGMPWLAIPFNDKSCQRLTRYFELRTLPTLIVIGSDGKTLQANAAELVEEHGIEAYPFSTEKLKELAEKEKARMEAQTLESLLVRGEQDYVLGKGGIKVPVSDLVGKNILLYFSAHWCPPCRAFLPKLIEAYHKIKAKDDAFEVIFISSDKDQSSFDDFFASMPWLALPFGDPRKKSLSRTFKIQGIPSLIAISPTGKTVTKEARGLITAHGANAYPFTEERIKELEVEVEEMAKDWPQKVKSLLHEQHELSLTQRRSYVCDKCEEGGSLWSFYCGECDFDLHPKCALEEQKENNDADEGQGHDEESGKEGYVCDGEACHKV